MAKGAGSGAFMGQEKEPSKQNPVRVGGKAPIAHSHSARPKRKIMPRRGIGSKTL